MLEVAGLTLETIANIAKLAASPVGQAILDKLILGGQLSPEKVAAAVKELEQPQPPKEA